MNMPVTRQEFDIIQRVRPFTMTSDARLLAVLDATRYLVRNRILGDFVECGVWKGGSMMAAALMLLAEGDVARRLFLYDTFAGMAPPTAEDRDHQGISAADQLRQHPPGTGIWCYAGLDEVRHNLASTGYPPGQCQFVVGKVEETIPQALPGEIALLRLDTDWYASTKHELEHLYPRLARRGVLIIDDYGHWRGSQQATDEYFAALGMFPLLHRIDYTGRMWIKP
jgi:hypothetical protein